MSSAVKAGAAVGGAVVNMSTVMICPRCGGSVGAAVAGKRACTCTKTGSSVATATVDSLHDTGARPGERAKLCCVCGKDVTHDRRMKDAATGRYWCFECGSANPIHKAHAMDVPCPECKRRFPPLAMMKFKDHYICSECYAKHAGKPLPGKAGEAAAPAKTTSPIKIALIIVGAIVFVLVAIWYVKTMME